MGAGLIDYPMQHVCCAAWKRANIVLTSGFTTESLFAAADIRILPL